jgi:hypothetical protein
MVHAFITSRRTSGQTLQEKKSLVQRDQDAIQAPGGLATRFSGVMWAKPSRWDLETGDMHGVSANDTLG